MSKEIIVTCHGNGTVTIETQGFQGTACKDATRDLEKALGTVTADDPTPEMHEREVRTISH